MNVSEDTPYSEMYWNLDRSELLSTNPQECVGSCVEDKYINITVESLIRGGEITPCSAMVVNGRLVVDRHGWSTVVMSG